MPKYNVSSKDKSDSINNTIMLHTLKARKSFSKTLNDFTEKGNGSMD